MKFAIVVEVWDRELDIWLIKQEKRAKSLMLPNL